MPFDPQRQATPKRGPLLARESSDTPPTMPHLGGISHAATPPRSGRLGLRQVAGPRQLVKDGLRNEVGLRAGPLRADR